MKDSLAAAFQERFGRTPAVFAAAPGRLEILGNHTDYNEGVVLSCAVDQRTAVVLAANGTRQANVYDLRARSGGSFNLDELDRKPTPKWLGYLAGVVSELRRRGAEAGGFDAVIASTVPLSAGMSSSAALETAVLFALCAEFKLEFPRAELARIGQGVENHYLGLKTGLLDQFSSIFGVAGRMIVSDFRTVAVTETVPLAPGCAILVVNSMQKHNLVDSEYNTRRAACENAAAKLAARHPEVHTLRDVSSAMLEADRALLTGEEYRRARHVVGECERVRDAVECLKAGKAEPFGALWWESHESSRVYFENSTPELDFLIDCSHRLPGALGARLSGGGFGGISIHLVRETALDDYRAAIAEAFRRQYGVTPETIVCHPGGGAESGRMR